MEKGWRKYKVNRMKKVVALFMALILCTGALTGCSSSGTPAEKVAVTINGTDLYLDEMMYYIYIQEDSYGMYDQMYQALYGFSFWDASTDGVTPNATLVKHEIVRMKRPRPRLWKMLRF